MRHEVGQRDRDQRVGEPARELVLGVALRPRSACRAIPSRKRPADEQDDDDAARRSTRPRARARARARARRSGPRASVAAPVGLPWPPSHSVPCEKPSKVVVPIIAHRTATVPARATSGGAPESGAAHPQLAIAPVQRREPRVEPEGDREGVGVARPLLHAVERHADELHGGVGAGQRARGCSGRHGSCRPARARRTRRAPRPPASAPARPGTPAAPERPRPAARRPSRRRARRHATG